MHIGAPYIRVAPVVTTTRRTIDPLSLIKYVHSHFHSQSEAIIVCLPYADLYSSPQTSSPSPRGSPRGSPSPSPSLSPSPQCRVRVLSVESESRVMWVEVESESESESESRVTKVVSESRVPSPESRVPSHDGRVRVTMVESESRVTSHFKNQTKKKTLSIILSKFKVK